jgi:solute carrier family 25 carnitine/acylcarnitine transporter 20/29
MVTPAPILFSFPHACTHARTHALACSPADARPTKHAQIRGLYSGASTQVMGVMPVNSTYWWGYDVGLRIAKWFREFTGNPSAPSAGVHPVDAMWAGAFSALPGTVVTAPIERIKVLLQQQALFPHRVTHKFNGLFDCGAHLLRTGGMRSLFRGFNITLIRDIPGSVCYFTANEIVRKKVQSMQADPSKPSVLATLAGGACAGMANWIVSLPADVVKTRWQSAADGRYRGLLDVVRHILHESGPSAFFRGIKPVLIRAAPTTATSFLGVELSRRVLFATGLFD